MHLTFLSAAIPLTKTIAYSQRDDDYTVTPYPMVTRVTSHNVDVKNMLEFATAIRQQGRLGRCLLFGHLDKELVDESRAGHAVEADHEWICFDFDKVDAAPTMEGALAAIGKYLPPICAKTECVIQLSPSCFHPRATKLSAHIFFRLAEPTPAKVLKDWIVRINFDHLQEQIRLTDSGNALSFPLDRCVTDASRLLYISPPKTVGFESPLAEVDALAHFRGAPALSVPYFVPVTREEMNAKINELRKANMLDEREFRTTTVKGMEMLLQPGACMVHDIRSSGDGYIRFNINGGDSQAYWINLREPQIIGNFKGEPYMYTREAAPEFFKALTKSLSAMPATTRTSPATEVLAFYATNRGSSLYIGTYDRAHDVLRVEKSTEAGAISWLKQFGVPLKGVLPHYDLTYDISSDIRYEEGYPVINLYARTEFIKEYAGLPKTQSLDNVFERLQKECPVIYKTIMSCAGDARSALGLINWISYIFQNRTKTDTAWLLHGTEGTGKGMLVGKILRPLFGDSNVGQILMNNVDSSFNSLLSGKLIVNVDEAAMSRTRDKVEAMAKLRNWITERTIVINEKREVEREETSFVNFIFTANDMRPLMIPEGDRRFHVGTRQEIRLHYMPNEIAALEQGEELPHFAAILGELMVDEHWVRNPEKTDQKAQLFENTHSLLDRVGYALRDGDTQFFIEARPSDLMRQVSGSGGVLPMQQYDALIRAMLDKSLNVLGSDDLFVLFHTVINDTKIFSDNPTQQKSIYARYGLAPKPRESHRCKRLGKVRHGVKAPEWKDVPEYVLEAVQHMITKADDTNVIPMNKRGST